MNSTTARPPDGNPSLTRAVELARIGGRVFPCHWIERGKCSCRGKPDCSPGKHPLWEKGTLEHGKDDANSEEKQILAWAKRWPRANWAIVPRSLKRVAIDVDGKAGQAAFKALPGYEKLPKTYTVRTGRPDSYHVYFALPDGFALKDSDLVENIVTPKWKGYVMLPGCGHLSGRTYTAVDPQMLVAPCPSWLLVLLQAPRESKAPDNFTGKIPKGKGEPMKFDLAWRMFKAGSTAEEVFDAAIARDKRCEHQEGEAAIERRVADWKKRFAHGESPSGPRRLEVVTLSDVQPKKRRWLWKPYLPAGRLATIDGDAGVGKTKIAVAISAAFTRGELPNPYSLVPPEACEPMDVLYLTNENLTDEDLRPMFDEMGGVNERFHHVKGTIIGEGDEARRGTVTLADVVLLREEVIKRNVRLVVVDPFQSYFGADKDMYRANETRPVLDALAKMAEETGCCVLILRHCGKALGRKAAYAGLGSVDITAAARVQMMAGHPPGDEEHRVLIITKSNAGPTGKAIGYRIDEAGRFYWTGGSGLTTGDILAPERIDRDSALDDAVDFIREFLTDGERPAKELEDAATARGIAERTMIRARKAAGVISTPHGFGGPRYLHLPQSQPNTPSVSQHQGLADTAKTVAETGEMEQGEL